MRDLISTLQLLECCQLTSLACSQPCCLLQLSMHHLCFAKRTSLMPSCKQVPGASGDPFGVSQQDPLTQEAAGSYLEAAAPESAAEPTYSGYTWGQVSISLADSDHSRAILSI